jgi:hypothetical protein
MIHFRIVKCYSCRSENLIKEDIIIPDLVLMSKPDAILRDRSTNGLVVYSLKTASTWTETNEKAG